MAKRERGWRGRGDKKKSASKLTKTNMEDGAATARGEGGKGERGFGFVSNQPFSTKQHQHFYTFSSHIHHEGAAIRHQVLLKQQHFSAAGTDLLQLPSVSWFQSDLYSTTDTGSYKEA